MREAGVGIILRYGRGIECLFIRRCLIPNDPWSGHIAFPGGRRKPVDKTILDTVYREVYEEVSIDLRKVGKLLFILPIASPKNEPELRVYPFVFRLLKNDVDIRKGCEVDRYYWISLNRLRLIRREINVGGEKRVMSVYISNESGNENIVIWGLTKRILDDLFSSINSLCINKIG